MATVQLALGPADSEPRVVRKSMAQLEIGDKVQVNLRMRVSCCQSTLRADLHGREGASFVRHCGTRPQQNCACLRLLCHNADSFACNSHSLVSVRAHPPRP